MCISIACVFSLSTQCNAEQMTRNSAPFECLRCLTPCTSPLSSWLSSHAHYDLLNDNKRFQCAWNAPSDEQQNMHAHQIQTFRWFVNRFFHSCKLYLFSGCFSAQNSIHISQLCMHSARNEKKTLICEMNYFCSSSLHFIDQIEEFKRAICKLKLNGFLLSLRSESMDNDPINKHMLQTRALPISFFFLWMIT